MASPALSCSNVVVIAPSPYTGRIVQPRPEQITSRAWLKKTLSCTTNSRSRLMNLSSARASSRMTSPGRNVVAPGLPGIDRTRRTHPVVRGRAGKHQHDVDRGRRNQAAVTGRLRIGLVEIERMGLADRPAVQRDRFAGERIGDGLARFA